MLPKAGQRIRVTEAKPGSRAGIQSGDCVTVLRARDSVIHAGYAFVVVDEDRYGAKGVHCLWEPAEPDYSSGWRFRCEAHELDMPRVLREAEEAGIKAFRLTVAGPNGADVTAPYLCVRKNTREWTHARELMSVGYPDVGWGLAEDSDAVMAAERIRAGRERDARLIVVKVEAL